MEAATLKRPKIPKETHKNHEEKCDPLMSLPEPLLHHILSCLAMKDVIRTSVLSKRWRYIWLYVPCLMFSPSKMSRSKEVAFINQSLLLHKGPAIQKFTLTFLQHDAETHHVDSWIYFAKTRNVNKLNLDFRNNHPETPSVRCYRLPNFLFSSTSLTALSLIRCEIHFPVNCKLSSLKILSLEQVNFSGGTVDDLTDATPFLESLSLTNCQRFADLPIYMFFGSTMTTLKIHESDQVSSSSMLSIAGDYIAAFELVTSMSRKYYFIRRMKSLESASLACNEVNCGLYKADKEKIIFEILDNVRHVKYLRLCSCYIQALCNHEEKILNCLSFDVSCVAMKTGLTKGELPGIGYMLRHSPNIKTLIINIDKIQAKKDVKIYNFLKNLEVPKSKELSTSEDFFAHLQNDMNFLRFLLKNSKVMERMTITTFKDVKFGRNTESKKINYSGVASVPESLSSRSNIFQLKLKGIICSLPIYNPCKKFAPYQFYLDTNIFDSDVSVMAVSSGSSAYFINYLV